MHKLKRITNRPETMAENQELAELITWYTRQKVNISFTIQIRMRID